MSREHGGFVMSGNVIEISQSKNIAPIWVQQLRVAAYCRVSTGHEEQQNSLKNQIEFYTDYIQRNPHWQLSQFTLIRHQDCGAIIVPAISSFLKIAEKRRST